MTFAAGTRAAADVHSELLEILKAEAKAPGKANPEQAPAPKPGPAPAAPLAPVAPAAPNGTLGAPLTPQMWNYFADTGILKSARGRKVTTELTFGPCTDGELLNQRYFW